MRTAQDSGSRISQRGCQLLKGTPTYYLANFSQNLHENEEILGQMGERASLALLDPPMQDSYTVIIELPLNTGDVILKYTIISHDYQQFKMTCEIIKVKRANCSIFHSSIHI